MLVHSKPTSTGTPRPHPPTLLNSKSRTPRILGFAVQEPSFGVCKQLITRNLFLSATFRLKTTATPFGRASALARNEPTLLTKPDPAPRPSRGRYPIRR